jgi:alkylation response protein AidB-like acyl-CoA dehydrogenase
MDGELKPITGAGKRFVALAEEHAADFATRAAEHDREGSFPHENIKALQQSGFMAAAVPEDLGGMGVTASHDFATGMSRLARGCASTAIASNMHMVSARVMARIWENRASQPPEMVGPTELFLKAIGAGQLVVCVPGTEAGTDVSAPMTEVTRVEGGYLLNGRKMFATLSPASQIMFSSARLRRDDGTSATMLCVVPLGTPGMEVVENWDALGMRASGSGEVIYKDCKLPTGSVIPQGEWGVIGGGGLLEAGGFGNSLPACFLGIAEAAQQIAIDMLSRRKGASGKRMADRVPLQILLGQNEIDLFAARAAIERVARITDAVADADALQSSDGLSALTRESQAMKWTIEHAAIAVVNRAMTISGGAGYLSNHPLSRLYRDVRAGPFMQPFGEYEVAEFLGKTTLGISPPLDR